MDNYNIGENIKRIRLSKNLTLEALANNLNSKYPEGINFNKGKLSKWENNKEEPMLSSIKYLADYFNVTLEDLYKGTAESNINVIYEKLNEVRQNKVVEFAEQQLEEQNNVVKFPEGKQIIRGRQTAAGSALYSDDYGTHTEVLSASMVPRGADELVEVVGKSMEPLIKDGEDVYIRHQPQVENGEIAIVRIEGDGVTCKRFYNDGKTITLKSENPEYEDMHFDPSQITVLGKVLL